jgi:NADPH:quinone reductase-like Zn-dependent oxidoreductase
VNPANATAFEPTTTDTAGVVGALPTTMRAARAERYGSPEAVVVHEVELPRITDEQVLVRVEASSVNPAEWYRVVGPVFARVADGLRRPKKPEVGGDLAGRVVAVGRNVTQWQLGDEVFGLSPAAWAEYAPARADKVARKPANVSFEDVGASPIAALTALQALRDHGELEAGQRVLINGASGGVGTYAVQIAKALGADVTAVCSTSKVELTRSLGADRVVDYTREDFTRLPLEHDLMLDIAGSRPFRHFRRVLTKDATVLLVGGRMNSGLGPLPHLGATIVSGRFRSQRVKFFVSKALAEDLELLASMFEAGSLKTVVDRRFELANVAAALRQLGEGHARGKIVLTP